MVVRALKILLAPAALAGLSGCVAANMGNYPVRTVQPVTPPPLTSQKVAALLPLTGPNAGLGHDLLQAVQLALGAGGPQLDVRDTGGTPTGATLAAQAAVTNGDSIIIGPLTAPETAAVAAVATSTPILAFTSDRQQGRPGVWALGITPQQQVGRLVRALSVVNKRRIAAVLPDNIFGAALADGLYRGAADAGDPPPVIRRYPNGSAAQLSAGLKDVSGYASRRGLLLDQARQTSQPDSLGAPSAPPVIDPRSIPPAPIDALLLAESGAPLRAAAAELADDDIAIPDVQVMGPATWSRDAATIPTLEGAWYAGPDPQFRQGFAQAYAARFGAPPPAFADIAYDAATIARSSAGRPALLTKPGGFPGVDGPLALLPTGAVLRSLAVFTIIQGSTRMIDPAPAMAPGS